MEFKTVTCDECGKVKLEGDRWFKALVGPGHFAIWGAADAMAEGLADRDICSEFCGKNAMAKAIRQVSKTADQPAPMLVIDQTARRRWHEQPEPA